AARVPGEALESRIVRHGAGKLRAESCVVLDTRDSWQDAGERLPEPVIVAVDVEGQQIDLARDAAAADELAQVLARDERAFRLHAGEAALRGIQVEEVALLLRAVHQQAAEPFVQDEG